MASGLTLTHLPPHLEGNLFFHRPAKFGIPRSKRGFFVLLETVIHRYDSESNYHKGQRSIKEFEIRLEEVCGITEVLLPSKPNKNCSFSLTLNDSTEHTFSAESRESMEKWVNGLRAAKEFWAQHHKREKVKQNLRQNPAHLNETVSVHNDLAKLDDSNSSTSSEDGKLIAQVHVTTWDGMTHKVLLSLVFDAEELLSALSGKIQGRTCANCSTCKLQQSTMEIWTVTASGIGKKLDHSGGALDVSKHGRHFYLLVHNYKLLIIHFEDGTFQVLPWLVSLKAKEVPYLPIFADKLSSLRCSNFGLFLVNESGTSFLFDPEEEPLKHSFQGRLLLKNRALTVVSVSPTSKDIQRQQLEKVEQNRKHIKAFKKAEQEKCKQNSNFHARNTSSPAFTSPHDLVFRNDYYSLTDVQNSPHASNCTGHTNIEQALSNEERTYGHTNIEQASSNEERIYGHTNIEQALSNEERICGQTNIEQASSDVERIYGHTNVQQASNDPTQLESLEPQKRPTENGGLSELMEENMKIENGYNDACKPSSSTDNNSDKFDVCGEKTRVEPNMTDNKSVNQKNETSAFGTETSEVTVANMENTSVENHRDATNEEITAPTNATYRDASIKSYLVATGDEMPVQNSGESNFEASFPDTSSNDSGDSCSSSVCKERPRFEIHRCDYTIVGSPRVLELVLKVCSGAKVNEEEVGEANIYTRICLSGWHLRCENGTWSLVERGGLHTFNDSLPSTVKVQLTEKLAALFHEEEKLWTVVENQGAANESLVTKDPIVDQSLNEDESKYQEAASSSGWDVLISDNKPQGDATFDKPSEAHPSSVVPGSIPGNSAQEAVHAAIQGIFHHMSKFSESPEEALDDSKHDGIVESACEPLCKALWNVLSVGLRKKRFLGKYTVWNIIENFKLVSSHVCQTVDWVNNKYACLGEPQKFQAFVCECLNIGRGTLHQWLESCLSQKERLAKYYGKDGVMLLLPRAKLEELVLDLSRISSLPFKLHSDSWIKKQGYDLNRPAFTFE